MSESSTKLSSANVKHFSHTWDIVYFPLGAAAFGGAERSLMELASAQQAQGMRVLICYERALESQDFITQVTARNLPLQRVEWSPNDSITQVAKTAWKLFRQLNTRLVHFNISWRRHMWLIPLVARIASSACLIGSMRAMPDHHDSIPRRRYLGFIPGLRLWTLPDHFIGRIWARTLHITVSVNRDDYPPRLIREYGFPPKRLRVVYNGVPIPDSMPDEAVRRAAKAKLGLSNEAFIAAYVGRISEVKGIHFAINAMSACDPKVELIVAGEGEQLEELKELTNKLGLSKKIHFIGYVSDPNSIFSASEIALVPSLWNEAFGRVVVEAMANGAVVIASAVGGMKELFTDGSEGFFVQKADSHSITVAVNTLCHDRQQWARMSAAGRKLAETRYATQRVATDYGNIYRDLLACSNS